MKSFDSIRQTDLRLFLTLNYTITFSPNEPDKEQLYPVTIPLSCLNKASLHIRNIQPNCSTDYGLPWNTTY